MSPIFHIAYPADWALATEQGEYRISTRGRTLEEQGFIHASGAHQVETVANAFYGEDDDLIVLVIDPAALRSELRYERARHGYMSELGLWLLIGLPGRV